MRLHRVLIIGLREALAEAIFGDKYADKVIEKVLKANKKWGSKDRAFVAESFYDIIRWRRKLEFYMGTEIRRTNMYNLIATYLLTKDFDIPAFDEFKGIDFRKIEERFDELIEHPAVLHSVPDWLYALLEKEYGNKTGEILAALNEQAEVYLRVNTLKTNAEDLLKSLAIEGIDAEEVEGHESALVIKHRKNLFRTSAFQDGWFEVQDLSSQLVAKALDPKPGMRVLDVCAGAGGKTLHIASLMQNKGQVIALDLYEWKLKELKRRAKRAGAHNIETRPIVAKTIKRLKDGADALLIDAPCSGLGVLKRNPDSKWKLDQDFIDRITKEQEEILQNYCKVVRKGGKMVYATCSILPAENEKQVEKFLANNDEFTLLNQETLLPNETGNDGFFIAVMERKA